MTCDLCGHDFSARPEVGIAVVTGAGADFGRFCSRFCAIHALVSSVSRDLADGPAGRGWRAGELVELLHDGDLERVEFVEGERENLTSGPEGKDPPAGSGGEYGSPAAVDRRALVARLVWAARRAM